MSLGSGRYWTVPGYPRPLLVDFSILLGRSLPGHLYFFETQDR